MVKLLQLESDLNDCLQNCSNNGICKLNGWKFKLECDCFESYAGSKCETSLDPCISNNPCLNNGTCILKPNSYECSCDENTFYGTNCEHRIDMCANYTCLNRGICKINEKTFSPYCSCLKYFSGETCEIQSSELVTIKNIISVASITAIIIIIVFYLIFILNDVFKYFIFKNQCLLKKKGKKGKKRRLINLQLSY